MKTNLPHEVVLDLLPGYIEHLNHPETDALVQAHLNACPSCAQTYARMAHEMDSPPENAHEIDYLKKIRRRGRWKVAGAALLAVVLVFGSFSFWTYGIGKMASTRSLRYFLYVSEPRVVIDGSTLNESETVKGVQWKQDGSTLVATIRTVPKRSDASSTFHSQYSPSAPVETVVVNGRVAWENGEKIEQSTSRLYDLRTPGGDDLEKIRQIVAFDGAIQDFDVAFEAGTVSIETPEDVDATAMKAASQRLLALVQVAHTVRWNDRVSYRCSDFLEGDKLKEAYDHPLVLQQALQSGQANRTIAYAWDDPAIEMVELRLWNGDELRKRFGTTSAGQSKVSLEDGPVTIGVRAKKEGEWHDFGTRKLELDPDTYSVLVDVKANGFDVQGGGIQ